MYICIARIIKYLNKGAYKNMSTYKDIKYFTTWLRGNWYLIIPDFQITIRLREPYTEDTLMQIIEDEVCQFI